MSSDVRRFLPSVDSVLVDGRVREYEGYAKHVVLAVVRDVIEGLRERISSGESLDPETIHDAVCTDVVSRLSCLGDRPFRRVINGTGVVLHTNLGRSLLNEQICSDVFTAATCYTDLEVDVETGVRGSRLRRVREMATLLTGAEDAVVVNNNAAAVLLALHTIAGDREVIVSRGELVEIGGSFRVPEIMQASGARLREVGTTNRTYVADYEHAITEDTALLLSVHPSNFSLIGFTASASITELAELGCKHNIPLMCDAGSGIMTDMSAITDEPTITEFLSQGADVVTFSGDKLLGGPQAGLIVGKRSLVGKMKKNPLMRTLRCDKMTLAALEAVLGYYIRGEAHKLATVSMLFLPAAKLRDRADKLAQLIGEQSGIQAQVVKGVSSAGGGSLPGTDLETYLVVVRSDMVANELATRLRNVEPPVFVRVDDDEIMIDVRTLLPGDDVEVSSSIADAVRG